MAFEEGQTVWVRQSNCGYQGPAKIIGQLHGSSWLVQQLEGDERVCLARAEFLEALKESAPEISEDLDKDRVKELKRKYKAERKSHRANGGQGRR